MACCVSNAVSYGRTRSPYSLFGWNFGKKKFDDVQQTKYHDIDLPFSLSLVDKTFLRGRELKCCYKATIDGFRASNFHNCCDFKGPCVIIGYTNKAFKFGAFNPEGYRSTDDYYDTFDPFLFYWTDNEKIDPIILPKIGGSGAALFDYARGGPQFGADGLLIGPPLAPVMGGFAGPDTNSGIGNLRQAKSRLGLSYAKREDGKESLFGDESYTNKAFKFGAFNPEGYRSTDDYYDTFDPFLFYWTDNEKIDPIILPKIGGSGAALFDYARGGPQFGADGLLIGPPLAPVMGGFAGPDTNSGIGNLRQAKSRLGLSYAKREDGKESLFGDESKAALDEVEVFCSPQIASLY
ncbi:hypothetical protein CJ030_MR4G010991 [Morella rubra]|uniref:TLDc domain-containing protein n=1 Tax=Morella rubra TaxID=262757 RepID=A0A6A1VSH8_9ROSI|nr:hypothetical protein CJ030_MR4G010991 [Morella rubra]